MFASDGAMRYDDDGLADSFLQKAIKNNNNKKTLFSTFNLISWPFSLAFQSALLLPTPPSHI